MRAIESTSNVVVRHRTEVVDGGGDGRLEWIRLADHANDSVEEVVAAALFIMIGGEPHTHWLPDEIARDPQGYVITGRDLVGQPGVHWEYEREPLTLETSMPGVFAAGDVRQGSIKRVASAVGEGATVVRLVHEHLREDEPDPVSELADGAPRSARSRCSSRGLFDRFASSLPMRQSASPVCTSPKGGTTMSSENKALVQKFYERFNAGDLTVVDDLVADDFVEHEEFPGLEPTKAGLRMLFESFHAAFEGGKFEVEDMVAEGDTVSVRVRARGTHRAEFMGVPASGRTIDVGVSDYLRLGNGLVVEHWGVMDTGALMQQLTGS